MVWGITNSSRLTFNLCGGDLDIELPEKYNAGGEMTENGAIVKYDPGQHDEFVFRFWLHIPENNHNENRTNKIMVTAANGKHSYLSIIQIGSTISDKEQQE